VFAIAFAMVVNGEVGTELISSFVWVWDVCYTEPLRRVACKLCMRHGSDVLPVSEVLRERRLSFGGPCMRRRQPIANLLDEKGLV
jgi:hypothetical protein